MPDEFCEVAEICSGTGLISSAIRSCGVHHLHVLRREMLSVYLFFYLLYMPHLCGLLMFEVFIRRSADVYHVPGSDRRGRRGEMWD